MTTAGNLLIGVDGGATEVKAHAVESPRGGGGSTYTLRAESAAARYPLVEGFVPVPMSEQLAQQAAGRCELTPAEVAQGQRWVSTTADVIAKVAEAAQVPTLQVGVAMPGLKTSDGRGIAVINHGPRIVDFVSDLTEALHARGLQLVTSLPPLQSDADCCGLGEQFAADGLFRDVHHAYYVGGGTGIADALKLQDQLVPLDDARAWIQKSWQMRCAIGPTFEQLLSARGMNALFARLRSCPTDVFPEEAAIAGDTLAQSCLDVAAVTLAELLYKRVKTIYAGHADAPHRGEPYAALDREHHYRGTILERVVIGQRLGMIYGNPRYRDVFAVRVDRCLATFIQASADNQVRHACLVETTRPDRPPTLRPGFLQASRLRAAPALGAAIVAHQTRRQ